MFRSKRNINHVWCYKDDIKREKNLNKQQYPIQNASTSNS